MIDLAEEFEAVISALAEHRIEYAVCGGLAMAIHGLPRATVDIDLLIRPETEDRVYAAVEPLGFRIRANPMHFDQGRMETRRISKIDPAGDTLMLDLLLVTPAFENVWRDRTTIESDFGPISVVSRKGLIELKSGRMSGVDQDDIKRLRDETDMSPAAVTLRIRRVSQLRNLCLRLAKAGAEARKKGQLAPLTPSTSKASSDR
jgi:hypothetical protein